MKMERLGTSRTSRSDDSDRCGGKCMDRTLATLDRNMQDRKGGGLIGRLLEVRQLSGALPATAVPTRVLRLARFDAQSITNCGE